MRNVPRKADPNFKYQYHSSSCTCVKNGCKRKTPVSKTIPKKFKETLVDMWNKTIERDKEHIVLFYREPTDYYVKEGEWKQTKIYVGEKESVKYPDLPSKNVTSPVYIHTHPPDMGKRSITFSPKDLVGYVPCSDAVNSEYSSFGWRGFGIIFGDNKPANVCDSVELSNGIWLKLLERNWRANVGSVQSGYMLQKDTFRSYKHSNLIDESREKSRNRLMGVIDDNIIRTVTKVE